MHSELTEAIPALFRKNWQHYKSQRKQLQKEREKLSYNIVSLSTYSGHLENYHSDIWRFLLDKDGVHDTGDHFLEHFLRYLVELNCITALDSKKLKSASVHREKGRIDLLLINEAENVCIIIENKINHAIDQNGQLDRYYNQVRAKGISVCAILYVSMSGQRLTRLPDVKVIPVAACNGQPIDMVDGWLKPAKSSLPPSEKEDVSSLVHQYCLLLKHLSVSTGQAMIAKTLYDLLNERKDFETAVTIHDELENIKLHRLAVFNEKMGNDFMQPFRKRTNYAGYPNHLIFQDWNYKGTKFQLDIIHYKDRTEFVFYDMKNNMPVNEVEFLLKDLSKDNSFQLDESNNRRHFRLSIALNDSIDSLRKLDEVVANKAKSFFEACSQKDKTGAIL